MKTAYITKTQLFDYVTKFEFEEFREEMRDFRESTEVRFAAIDKRFDGVDRRFDRLEESFRVQTGLVLQEMRSISQATKEYMRHIESKMVTKEYMQHIESRMVDKERFESLEDKVNQILAKT